MVRYIHRSVVKIHVNTMLQNMRTKVVRYYHSPLVKIYVKKKFCCETCRQKLSDIFFKI